MKKVFQTADGTLHTSARKAAKHEASIALSMHITEHCTAHDDGLFDVEDVANYVVRHEADVRHLVNAFNEAKLTPDYTLDEVQDWVILKLFYASEYVGEPNSGYTQGIVKRVWDYLQMESGTPNLDQYSALETDLAERAWDHFEGEPK